MEFVRGYTETRWLDPTCSVAVVYVCILLVQAALCFLRALILSCQLARRERGGQAGCRVGRYADVYPYDILYTSSSSQY